MEHQNSRSYSNLEKPFQEAFDAFKSCICFYGIFHVSFISFLCAQLLVFLLFFSYFSQSLAAACGLALFFLTLFCYFVLLFFFQAKKPEQLQNIRARFLESCQAHIPLSDADPSSLLCLSEALDEFAHYLGQRELLFYASNFPIKALIPISEKFKIWLYWKSFHQMKEIFLAKSIEIAIALVKKLPTNIEIHASLAESYTKLCKLYVLPQKIDPSFSLPWISPEYTSPFMKDQFLFYSNKAIEEFKILEDLSSKDPWVLAHLAEIYRLQEKAEDEILQCEELLKLTPHNVELLFKLGILYFKEGYAAKGLRIYEVLQKDTSDKAQKLIEYYS